MYSLNGFLGMSFFVIAILFMVYVAITDKQIYLIGVLFFIPSLFFLYFMAKDEGEFEYLKMEILCGIYDMSILDTSMVSRAPYPKIHYVYIHNDFFKFRSTDYPYKVDFNNIYKGQKICITLQRRADKPENLSVAKLISVELKNSI